MHDVVLMDGGMGQELLRRSGNAPTPLWSTQHLIDDPALVRDLHVDFIRAGARVITLSAYTATPERLQIAGVADRYEALQQTAIDAAWRARDLAGIGDVAIAGCLPPLVASYRPDKMPEVESARRTYDRIVATQAPHVDVLLCETMASIAEATTAAQAALASGKPVWVALTVSDDEPRTLRSGEPLADAVAAIDALGVAALFLNCSRPEAIAHALPLLASPTRRFGAYANGFTSIDALLPGGTVSALKARQDLGPAQYAERALPWAAMGARFVGGCCEVGPAHIAALGKALTDHGYRIVGLEGIADAASSGELEPV